ncbi:MAG: hypothetical protein KBD06_03955 [Candidatus Pacebacteria bacterium]|nr:hypothetical protein [Candidatus Paceibacterota bacterium]
MTTELPPCEDFVIATIRQVRITRSTVKNGAKAGVSLTRVLHVAREFYTTKQLTRAVASLHKKNKIVIVSEWDEFSKAEGEDKHSYRRSGTILLDKIRPFAEHLDRISERNWWKLDERLEELVPSDQEPKTYRKLKYGTVHIVEDGLSAAAKKPKRSDIAHKVMQSLKSK